MKFLPILVLFVAVTLMAQTDRLPFSVEGKAPKDYSERSALRAYDIAVREANVDINPEKPYAISPSVTLRFSNDPASIKADAQGHTTVTMSKWSLQGWMDGVYLATFYRMAPNPDKRRAALQHMVSSYNAAIDWHDLQH